MPDGPPAGRAQDNIFRHDDFASRRFFEAAALRFDMACAAGCRCRQIFRPLIMPMQLFIDRYLARYALNF